MKAKKPSQLYSRAVKKTKNSAKTAVVNTVGTVLPMPDPPDEALRELFDAVQRQRIYDDGKTFVDMRPIGKVKSIMKAYRKQRQKPDFDLAQFIDQNFLAPQYPAPNYQPTNTTTAREHVTNLWGVLRRSNRRDRGSLISLPYAYITPGGRFDEQFYWDTYFTMQGLAADGEWDLIYGMVRNYSYMLRKLGMIPTANRTYFLSRSQPPFFSNMVRLLAEHNGRARTFTEFLPSMLSEYRFWMKGKKEAAKSVEYSAYLRAVAMPDGTILNRYYDNRSTPRPESHREDLITADEANSANKNRIFLDLRAAAESGWDFSSRWFADVDDIRTIETTNYVAVDLNCLLYQLEKTIAEAYSVIKQRSLARRFEVAAKRRAAAIRHYCWNSQSNFFEDYKITTGHVSGRLTLAGVFPLFAGVATNDQAQAVAERLEKDFLCRGGLVTTLIDNKQQWDSPNGWAPLQWVAIVGLRNYGYDELAETIRDRWLELNELVFVETQKMLEKYDVVNIRAGAGGEYPVQDGFGWTNGVYAALKDDQRR